MQARGTELHLACVSEAVSLQTDDRDVLVAVLDECLPEQNVLSSKLHPQRYSPPEGKPLALQLSKRCEPNQSGQQLNKVARVRM